MEKRGKSNSKIKKVFKRSLMGGPMSLVFSDICKCKMEKDVVKRLKPIFYKRYVDDMYVKKNVTKQILFLMR